MKIVFKSIDQHLLLCTLTAFTSIANAEVTIPENWPRMQAGDIQVEMQFDDICYWIKLSLASH